MFKGFREKVRKTIYIPLEISEAVERRASDSDYETFSAVISRILVKEFANDIAEFKAAGSMNKEPKS